MAQQRLIIAGGSGALGQGVANHFADLGFEVAILTRKATPNSRFKQLVWNGSSVSATWGKELKGAILLNLAGELVDRVPTRRNVDLLASSRVQPTTALVQAARKFGAPKLWLQMSTLAIYGDAGSSELDETSEPAAGPRQMAGVASAWESSATGSGCERMAILRTAVVLQRDTPALSRLVKITKLFLGGRVASGKQWVSWIHFEDFVAALKHIIGNDTLGGVVHVTSPSPVTNEKLMKTLRTVLHRPWTPPTPQIAIRLGAWLLFRTDPALALTGRRAVPAKLQKSGFVFQYPELQPALEDLLRAETLS
jgi:uncharacterized protein (TIGR01777 family)